MVLTKPVKPPAMIDKALVKGPNSDIEELGANFISGWLMKLSSKGYF